MGGRIACSKGTRVSLLKDLTTWLLADSPENVLWLSGAAGSGKSTIARSIQDYMVDLLLCGAYIRFERGKSAPDRVIRTLAYKLALYSPHIANSVSSALKGLDLEATPIERQYTLLLHSPLSNSRNEAAGPIIVIIDALDECGDAKSREELLQILSGLVKFPNYRFLVTGRPENDLETAFAGAESPWTGHVRRCEVDCTSEDTQRDILAYLRHELQGLCKAPLDVAGWDSNINKLAEATSGLFIYASTSAKLIQDDDSPSELLADIVSGSLRLSELDELYTTVLQRSGVQWENPRSASIFKNLISFMVFCQEPLSEDVVDGIYDGLFSSSNGRASGLLQKLRPLIDYKEGGHIIFRHVTIPDYFLSPRSQGFLWSIDISSQRCLLTQQCFTFMEKHLRFNIAGLCSSFLRNYKVYGLKQTIPDIIPAPLRYASLYWAKHLSDCDFAQDRSEPRLVNRLDNFLKTKLLYWLEVLSLLEVTNPDAILHDADRWTSLVGIMLPATASTT